MMCYDVGAVAEWIVYQLPDVEVANSNPGGGTFSTRNNLE